MYGKKRIVITKRNEVVLAGGGSWCPVGYLMIMMDNSVRATVLKDRHINTFPRDHKEFEEIKSSSRKELKGILNKKYKWER